MAQRLWTPNDLAVKPIAWFDAGDAATLSLTGGVVIAWANKGTGGGSAISQTPANGPLYNATGFSGTKPGITWAGGNKEALRTTVLTSSTTAAFAAFGSFQVSASDTGVRFLVGTANGTRFDIFLFSSGQFGYDIAASDKQSGINVAVNTSHIFGVLYNSNGSTAANSGIGSPYIDGVAGNTATYTPAAVAEIGIGTYAGGTSGQWGGYEKQLIFLNYVPSVADRQLIEGYLAWDAGTQARLPTSHPYAAAAPTVSTGGPTFSAGSGAIILTARAANLLLGHTLPAAQGALVLSGQPVRVAASRRIEASAGAISLIGSDAALRQARFLAAQAGVLALTGAATSLARSRQLGADGTQLAIGGRQANLLHGFSLPAQAGVFDLAAAPASLRTSHRISAEPGALQLDGQSVSLGRSNRLVLDAAAADVLYAGQPAMLRLRRRLIAAPGSVAANGIAAAFGQLRGLVFGASAGTFSLAGMDTQQLRILRLAAECGSASYDGVAATMRISRRLIAQLGSFVLSARSATLRLDQARPPIVIPPYNCFVVPARQRFFSVPARQRAFIIRKGTSMSISRQTADERQYQADWSSDLNGQTIDGEISAVSSDPALIVDRVEHNGKVMTFWLSGGRTGGVATIEFLAPTSGGETLPWEQTVVCS